MKERVFVANNERQFREALEQDLPIEAPRALLEKFGYFPVSEEVGSDEHIDRAAVTTGAGTEENDCEPLNTPPTRETD